jgi:hypothetical protein
LNPSAAKRFTLSDPINPAAPVTITVFIRRTASPGPGGRSKPILRRAIGTDQKKTDWPQKCAKVTRKAKRRRERSTAWQRRTANAPASWSAPALWSFGPERILPTSGKMYLSRTLQSRPAPPRSPAPKARAISAWATGLGSRPRGDNKGCRPAPWAAAVPQSTQTPSFNCRLSDSPFQLFSFSAFQPLSCRARRKECGRQGFTRVTHGCARVSFSFLAFQPFNICLVGHDVRSAGARAPPGSRTVVRGYLSAF